MSWYAEEDGRIMTNEEFEIHCCNCSAFCAEGKISVSCGGDRNDCPHFKEVDTSEYEKEIRRKAIEEFAEKIELEISESIIWDILATASKNSSLSDISDEIIIYITETIKETAKNIKVGAE